jgi:hypothetical protein
MLYVIPPSECVERLGLSSILGRSIAWGYDTPGGDMSLDSRDIRPTMDVFTIENEYLGSVLSVEAGSVDARMASRPDEPASEVNGELAGPAPTQDIGNSGPRVQSPRSAYATMRDDAGLLGQGSITVGKHWGLIGRKTVPLSAVRGVSIERVVVDA